MGNIFKRLSDLARSEITHLTQKDREFNKEFLEYFRQQPEFDAYKETFENMYGEGPESGSRQQQQSRRESASADTSGLKYDPYATLEVGRNASFEEIEKAYRKMARKYHPDRYQTEKERELATKIMSSVNAAFTFLKEKHKS